MTTTEDHRAAVERQFGPRAAAYVASAVHAGGADLDWMADALAAGAPARVLDLGCGGGHVSYRAAATAARVTAVDLSPAMLAAVRTEAAARGLGNIETVEATAEALPFAAESFDAVLSRFSAHHWGDVEAGLREAARVLRAGGRFLLVDAASPGAPFLDTHLQAVELLRDPSHVRDYSPAEWLAMLNRAGLAAREMRTARLRLDFAAWTERMATPPEAVRAIRTLQNRLPDAARRYFAVEADGSFALDTLWVAALKP